MKVGAGIKYFLNIWFQDEEDTFEPFSGSGQSLRKKSAKSRKL